MHVDALTLAALTAELRADLLGARIEDVIQPTPRAIALHCWGAGRTSWLLASAHPQFARVHLIERKPQKLTTEPPVFVMLLRKHVEGARIIAIHQPPWERVLELGCARGASPPVWLIVEIMGRLSNLVLRDEAGTILGALRLVRADVNRYRTIAPNELYRPPPPQTRTLAGQTLARLEGASVTADDLRVAAEDMLAGAASARRAPRVADLLMAHLRGFSADAGREVAARALAAPETPLALDVPWDAVAREARALAALPTTGAWLPTLVLDHSAASAVAAPSAVRAGEPVAFAAYEPRQYAGLALQPMPSMSATLAAYYRRAEWHDAVAGAKSDLQRTLQTRHERCLRKADVLQAELDGLAEADRLREEGDILLAYQTQIAPGATRFTVENPFGPRSDGSPDSATIALDPQLTPVENANRRFARYQKLRRAAAQIPPQLQANAIERARVEQLLTDLALAETTPEIALVRAELAEAGYLRGRRGARPGERPQQHGAKPGKGKPGALRQRGKSDRSQRESPGGTPLRRQSSDGVTVLVGRNSQQNETVTFHQASGGDLWLHARGVPGAHVIVKSGGRPVPEATLHEAAALAAYYSQARAAASVAVDYTEQRHVRHLKGGGPGLVTYERERTLHVAPEDAGE
jgi:predicted ribosome quality control (RQC) complex YloA/Tae2 family protein